MKKLIANWLIGNVVQKHTTKAPYNDVVEQLTEAVRENDFSIVSVHDMRKTYEKNDLKISDDFDYKIIQICNAEKSHRAVTKMSFDMGVMMPKSIIVARENSKTTLRFLKMKPWIVSMMFPELNILPMSKTVSNTMQKIVVETIQKAEEKNIDVQID
jgi:uncharacterized protein (DUF302 family)